MTKLKNGAASQLSSFFSSSQGRFTVSMLSSLISSTLVAVPLLLVLLLTSSLLSGLARAALVSSPHPHGGFSGRPQLSITIRDGNFTSNNGGMMDGLDPTITWQNSALLHDDEIALTYGIDLSARTTNLASLPRRIWGRASRRVRITGADREVAISTRVQLDFDTPDTLDFEFDGEDDESDVRVRIMGRTSTAALSSVIGGNTHHLMGERTSKRTSGSNKLKSAIRNILPTIDHVEITKGYDNNGNRITINPRYNIPYNYADVILTYDADDTVIKVIAGASDQSVTISQKLNDDNIISPTINARDGSLSLAWDRKLGEDQSVKTTVNPNRSVDVEWRDSAWTANVNFPMDGSSDDLQGATVHIKRDIKF